MKAVMQLPRVLVLCLRMEIVNVDSNVWPASAVDQTWCNMAKIRCCFWLCRCVRYTRVQCTTSNEPFGPPKCSEHLKERLIESLLIAWYDVVRDWRIPARAHNSAISFDVKFVPWSLWSRLGKYLSQRTLAVVLAILFDEGRAWVYLQWFVITIIFSKPPLHLSKLSKSYKRVPWVSMRRYLPGVQLVVVSSFTYILDKIRPYYARII